MSEQTAFTEVPSGHPVLLLLLRHNAMVFHDAFITHVDRSPISSKAFIFLMPFTMNLSLAALLVWRGLSSTSNFHLVSIFLGGDLIPYRTRTPSDLSWPSFIFWLLVDASLFTSIPRVLWSFASGQLWMRLRCGFRDAEIVFRKPTGYTRSSINSLPPDQFQTAYTNSIYRAIDPQFLKSNVGFNTRSGFWVLDYSAPIDAYKLVDSGQVSLDMFELSVWQRFDGNWAVWDVYAQTQKNPELNSRAMSHFVAKLQSVGREDLLQRYLALIQVDGNKESAERIQHVEQMFRDAGLDFIGMWMECLETAKAEATPIVV